MTFEMIARGVARFVPIAACVIASAMPASGGAAEEPRLDLQATASRPFAAQEPIVWTIRVNNGGRGEARGATAAWKTFFDSGVGAGVVIFDELPRFRGVPLALVAPPTVTLDGVADGVTAGFYYSVSREIPSVPKDWSAVYLPGARWIALLLSGGSANVQLPAAPLGSQGAGAVWKPQATIAFSTKQPIGVCSRESDAVTNMADGVVADAAGMLLGPGIPAGTRDGVVSLAAAAGNGRPGSGPLRTSSFGVHRRWLIFGRLRCDKILPTGT